jgi:hypothetical protein
MLAVWVAISGTKEVVMSGDRNRPSGGVDIGEGRSRSVNAVER